MKNFLIALAVTVVASCAGPRGTVNLEPDSAFARTAQRVVERCPQEDADVQSFSAFINAMTGDVSVEIVGPLYDPVEEIHDLQVLTDPDLDALEQEVYIGDTQMMRGLLTARGYVQSEDAE